MIADKDLLSMQCARILGENAREAQQRLNTFSQEKLDEIVEAVAAAMELHAPSLAAMAFEETGYGRQEDKILKIRFVCRQVTRSLRGLRCVGVLKEEQGKVQEIGVPKGVIAALCPSISPVSTLLYKALLAVKSGNAIIFSLHPHAHDSMQKTLDLIIEAAQKSGLPENSISYLSTTAKGGTRELMRHPAVSLVWLTGVNGMLDEAQAAGKPLICGGTGNGPAFIERSADIAQAVGDILFSKTFDCGLTPSAEQCVVVDACIADEVRREFRQAGAYFMTEKEAGALAALFFHHNGQRRRDMIGQDAPTLARRAAFTVPEGTRLLVAERPFVSDGDSYNRELLNPVLPLYIEDDWMSACEKCLELLLHERSSHTLTIHSRNPEVIRQFALKKPVARILVNTPASLGGIGATSGLCPALTLGCALAGYGSTSDNVSPMNLVYIRRVGYGMTGSGEWARSLGDAVPDAAVPSVPAQPRSGSASEIDLNALRQMVQEALHTISGAGRI